MGDLVLNGENISQITIITVGPDVTAIFPVNELAGDADTGAGLSHAPFQDKVHAETFGSLLHVHMFALVSKRGVARHDEQAGHFR